MAQQASRQMPPGTRSSTKRPYYGRSAAEESGHEPQSKRARVGARLSGGDDQGTPRSQQESANRGALARVSHLQQGHFGACTPSEPAPSSSPSSSPPSPESTEKYGQPMFGDLSSPSMDPTGRSQQRSMYRGSATRFPVLGTAPSANTMVRGGRDGLPPIFGGSSRLASLKDATVQRPTHVNRGVAARRESQQHQQDSPGQDDYDASDGDTEMVDAE